MFHKVRSVTPISDFSLLVEFENGSSKVYDIKPLFAKWRSFQALADIAGLFEQVRVDTGGYGISWNDDLDLACDELYHNGSEIESDTIKPG